jgi:Cd2+/Zn2+-exporting ATPase
MSNSVSKLKLDLPIVLPDVPDARDDCVRTLLRMLRKKAGIFAAHVEPAGTDQPARLCLHYDPREVSLTRVRELAVAAGAQVSERIGHVVGLVSPALHARAASALAARLRRCHGVLEADVSASGALRIEFDRVKADVAGLSGILTAHGLAYAPDDLRCPVPQPPHARPPQPTAEPVPRPTERPDDHDHAHGGLFGEHRELIFAVASGLALLAGWLIGVWGVGPERIPTGLYVLAIALGGWFTAREAIGNLRARRFEIDTLMLVAAAGAMALGAWAEAALLLFLFSLGHALEHWAMGRARRAIDALATLAPERAIRRRGAATEEVPVESLAAGDVILVRPNERLAADGIVLLGSSSVNQAPITGESVPVEKRPASDVDAELARFESAAPEHRVFAGTINGAGALEVKVARPASQTTLARVMRMVVEAESQRSPTQRLTERFERIFVPVILALTVLLLLAWVVVDEPFATSFYRAMAVLVAASPCALAISVPSAVLSGVARAARSGVLVKGGAALEDLGTLTAIAFDKTGTLTEGKPRLTDVVPADGATEQKLLRVAVALEQHSDHPLAAAIVLGGRARLGKGPEAASATEVQSITGRGITGTLDGQTVHIGKAALFAEVPGGAPPAAISTADAQLVEIGRSTMIVRQGERYLGVLGVMDTPRAQAPAVMARLREIGITRLIMISGDHQRVAEAVSKSVGLTEARGDLMPEDKVAAIVALRAEAGKVAMVGDGVNDAPAMANATVGIAMGAAGSDVALETADVALMADDLTKLPFAVALSRRTSRVIRQNLWISLGVVAVLIPSTILGLQIGVAVLAHEGSTLLVVVNALRLLAFSENWRST